MITHKQVLETFEYRNGTLFWRKHRYKRLINTAAGFPNGSKKQYLYVAVSHKMYGVHRLIWFYHHGCWPRDQIDHIDGNTFNNCIQNLRECTIAENAQNRIKQKGNNPYTGVGETPQGNYAASIYLRGKQIYLGRFNTAEAARDAYLAAKKIHHTFNPVPR